MRTRRVLIFVAIGFLTSLLVAWTVSVTVVGRVKPIRTLAADDPLLAPLGDDPTRTTFAAQAYYGFGCDAECVYASDGSSHDTLVNAWTSRAGWPMRCVRGTRISGATTDHGLRGAWPIPRRRLRHVFTTLVVGFLPYEPIWLGLIVDTALFGFVAWIVIRGPGTLRRRSRRRSGACEACGYLLAGAGRCAECGVDGHGHAAVASTPR